MKTVLEAALTEIEECFGIETEIELMDWRKRNEDTTIQPEETGIRWLSDAP
jgi:hypothetical protein